MKNQKIYLTTSIAYVNGSPHVGHALEIVQADVLARSARFLGQEVFFLTGTDEHGQKIYETAQKEEKKVQEFIDGNTEKFRTLYEQLGVDYDDFIRTSQDRHMKAAKKLWELCNKKGDIYKKKYEGLYCVGCETFITPKDLVNGLCAIHKKAPEKVSEENYFFRLSGYTEKIKQFVQSGTLTITPSSRRNEFLSLLEGEGLEDISISREKERLPWGIEVPGDASQVMYVWFDALPNYISGIGYGSDEEKFRTWWEDGNTKKIHMIGKDILRQHAALWPGMLLSAGIRTPDQILVHGFVTSGNQKMSKSVGNVVDPKEYAEKYGAESLRYFLLRGLPTFEDGDFTEEQFIKVYNADLAHSLGNTVSRITQMINKYADGKIEVGDEEKEKGRNMLQKKYGDEIEKYLRAYDWNQAVQATWKVFSDLDQYIEEKKPWSQEKLGDTEALQDTLKHLYLTLEYVAFQYIPIFLPQTGKKMQEQMQKNVIIKEAPLFPVLP